MTPKIMKTFVDENPTLVKLKPTSMDNVFVLKYTKKVFFKSLWTVELENARGTVVDGDYNIISRPFTKIYNRGERNTDIDRDTKVVGVEKVNGFMACATWHNGKLLVSTTGTIDSDFAMVAKTFLIPFTAMFKNSPNLSFIFEICDPNDVHIIPEKFGVYLLGARYKTWDSLNHALSELELDLIAQIHNIMRPSWGVGRFGDYVDDVKICKHEGFVCYTLDGKQELKMKSPYYLATKFLGRIREERLNGLLIAKNQQQLRQIIDEEFYGIIETITADPKAFIDLNEQERMAFVRTYFDENVL